MISIDGKVVDFSKFPNGETLFNHNSLEALTGWEPQRVLFKWEDDSDFVKLTILKDYLDSIGVEPDELLITYMPYSRNDRSENGSPFTLKSVAHLINRLNFKDVYIVEPHSDVTCAVVDKSSSIKIVPTLLSIAKQDVEFNMDTDFIVFPDTTSNKRYGTLAGPNQLTGLKHRNFGTGKIESLELAGKIKGECFKAILVDDLCSYGGSFLLTAEKLKELGASEIYLVVGHCEDSIFKGKLFSSGLVDKVYTTDSLLSEHKDNMYTAKFKEKLTVFDIEEIV